jgi:hypothetical protein
MWYFKVVWSAWLSIVLDQHVRYIHFHCWFIFIILAFVTCHQLTWYAMNEKPLWGERNILKSFHTHVYFLSKVRSFLDVRFSLKCVYLFCKFQGFETFEYISQDHLMISHCANKNGQIGTTWNYRLKTNFSISAAAEYSQNFQTFAQVEVVVYERNIIYRHCKFSANVRFREMFYPQNFVF